MTDRKKLPLGTLVLFGLFLLVMPAIFFPFFGGEGNDPSLFP